jgi:hypothetical protein
VTLTSSVRISVPQNHWIAERITKARPIDISISCRKPAPLARIGPHMVRSESSPSSPVASIARAIPAASGMPQVTLTR